jgi:hypothetical protein
MEYLNAYFTPHLVVSTYENIFTIVFIMTWWNKIVVNLCQSFIDLFMEILQMSTLVIYA